MSLAPQGIPGLEIIKQLMHRDIKRQGYPSKSTSSTPPPYHWQCLGTNLPFPQFCLRQPFGSPRAFKFPMKISSTNLMLGMIVDLGLRQHHTILWRITWREYSKTTGPGKSYTYPLRITAPICNAGTGSYPSRQARTHPDIYEMALG